MRVDHFGRLLHHLDGDHDLRTQPEHAKRVQAAEHCEEVEADVKHVCTLCIDLFAGAPVAGAGAHLGVNLVHAEGADAETGAYGADDEPHHCVGACTQSHHPYHVEDDRRGNAAEHDGPAQGQVFVDQAGQRVHGLAQTQQLLLGRHTIVAARCVRNRRGTRADRRDHRRECA